MNVAQCSLVDTGYMAPIFPKTGYILAHQWKELFLVSFAVLAALLLLVDGSYVGTFPVV
jgi:hypothetical protein